MAAIALLDVFTYTDGHDFTCDTNEATLEMTVAQLNKTTFCSNGWTELVAGLKATTFAYGGVWQAGSAQVDPEAFPNLGSQKTFTMGPDDTEGSVAYMWQAKDVKYELPRGSYGELAQFMLNAVGSNGQGVVRGQLTAAKQTISGTGSVGTAVNIATTSESGYVYATLHTFSLGTSYTAEVQSATESGFASPATVGSFSISSAGGSWMTRVAATSGQNYYRLMVTGCTGSHDIACAIAVQ